jgi:hypothetical protein
MRLYGTTTVFDSTAGPPGSKGAVTFDRAFSQYLDGGSHTFNIASNGGFMAVAVVKFTGVVGSYESVIDFGNGDSDNNIVIYRETSTSNLIFGIWTPNAACVVSMPSAIIQNNWLQIVAVYTSSSKRLELRVRSATVFTTCATTRTDWIVSNTFVAHDYWDDAW